MKLKKLTIHNIASIEHAEIDFSGDVLADREIFLICGPTGAGKSTILDAISLALFKSTPRIEKSKSAVVNAFDAGGEKNKFNNVKTVLHLVRKNAVEAYTTLTFETADGEYTASWRVYRTGQYRSGKETSTFAKLSLAEKVSRDMVSEWTLTDPDGCVHQKGVEDRIQAVIKMNFEQFCRTTMLAQGDFTMFLTFEDKKKGEILEKLVGSEKYARVGDQINKTYIARKNEVEALVKALENFTFLSDDDKQARADEIVRLDARIKQISERKALADSKVRWIADRDRAAVDVAKAATRLETATNAMQTDEAKRVESIIALLDTTVEVRQIMASKAKALEDRASLASDRKRLVSDYAAAAAGLAAVIEQKAGIVEENEKLAAEIESQACFEQMFKDAGVICAKHASAVENERYVADSHAAIEDLDKKIYDNGSRVSEVSKTKDEALAEIRRHEDSMKDAEDKLATLGASTVDKEKDDLNRHKTLVIRAENALANMTKASKDHASAVKVVEEAESTLAMYRQEAAQAAEKEDEARKRADESREIYNKEFLALDDHARAIRARLRVDDKCPVCGHIVEHLLDEDEIREALKPMEEKCRTDEQCAKQAAETLMRARTNADNAENLLKRAQSDEKLAEAEEKKYKDAFVDACTDLCMSAEEVTEQSLERMKSEDEEAQQKISARQAGISGLRARIKAAADRVAMLRRTTVAGCDKESEKLRKEAQTLTEERSLISGRVEKARATALALREEITALIHPDWRDKDEDVLDDQLRDAAARYAEINKRNTENTVTIGTLVRTIDQAATWRERVDGLYPQWSEEAAVVTAKAAADPGDAWSRIGARAEAMARTSATVEKAIEDADREIAVYVAEHPDSPIEEVEALSALSAEDISGMRKMLAGLREEVSKATALSEEANARMRDFPPSPLADGDTAESLAAEMVDADRESNECAQRKGSILREIEADAENRRAHGRRKAQLDEKRAELTEWKWLNDYLGSTDGKNFRNVAQSFILSDLLDKANAYLESMSTRYSLFCYPGTLTIMMRDSWQGNVDRPTNTLSGGESFIISLSLALGLSSMQNVETEIDTLFIDEGFGTLSPEYLDPVMTALKRLNKRYGRRVGIISHVESLKQRISAVIEVSRRGTSAGTIDVKCV